MRYKIALFGIKRDCEKGELPASKRLQEREWVYVTYCNNKKYKVAKNSLVFKMKM